LSENRVVGGPMKRKRMAALKVVILDDEKNVEEAIRSKLPKAIAAGA
jgi:hypothetical protein